MIVVRNGNLFSGEHQAYARAAHLDGAMNRGVALKFKSLYPDLQVHHQSLYKQGAVALGDLFCYEPSGPRPEVLNLVVMDPAGRVLPSAFESAIEKMYGLMQERDFNDVGMCKMSQRGGPFTEERFLEALEVIRKDSLRHVTVYEALS